MTAATQDRTLSDWLEELLTVPPADRRMVLIEGLRAQLRYRKVRCLLHDVSLDWLQLAPHFRTSESDDNPRRHAPGDLVPASRDDDEPRPVWSTSTCTKCDALIVWAVTPGGRSVPVDVEPNPAGDVVLTRLPEQHRPAAVYLHTDAERASAPAASIHTVHIRTCEPRHKARSRRGHRRARRTPL